MSCAEFQPLRVMAFLRTPVISDQWLPLDSVLNAFAMQDTYGPPTAFAPGQVHHRNDGRRIVPLKKINPKTDIRYYACSWAQPQPWWAAEGKDHWNKRMDVQWAHLIDFEDKRGRIDTKSGRYKAYHMPVFYRVASHIEWYCVGELDRIRELLAHVTHLGKKTVQGWGRVDRWIVEPWSEDWSVWRDGKLTRGVPLEDYHGDTPDLMLYGIRPPYWDKRAQMMLVRPG